MSDITRKSSLKEVALIVGSHLRSDGIDAVLTGGAVVSIYTENAYESFDLDFISHTPVSRISESLAKIGFEKTKGRYFVHPQTDFYVEFPSPPVAVGNKPLTLFHEIETESGFLKLLTPTQCVMDRLAAYYYWDDKQSLEQAILVAKSHEISIREIEEWSESEEMSEKYGLFMGGCNL